MSLQFKIKRNDREPSLAFICTLSDGSIVDLTTATGVTFAMRKAANVTAAPKVNAAAVVVNAAAGSVRYDWAAGDLDTAGDYSGEFQVTFPTALPMTFPGGDYIRICVTPDIAT